MSEKEQKQNDHWKRNLGIVSIVIISAIVIIHYALYVHHNALADAEAVVQAHKDECEAWWDDITSGNPLEPIENYGEYAEGFADFKNYCSDVYEFPNETN